MLTKSQIADSVFLPYVSSAEWLPRGQVDIFAVLGFRVKDLTRWTRILVEHRRPAKKMCAGDVFCAGCRMRVFRAVVYVGICRICCYVQKDWPWSETFLIETITSSICMIESVCIFIISHEGHIVAWSFLLAFSNGKLEASVHSVGLSTYY